MKRTEELIITIFFGVFFATMACLFAYLIVFNLGMCIAGVK